MQLGEQQGDGRYDRTPEAKQLVERRLLPESDILNLRIIRQLLLKAIVKLLSYILYVHTLGRSSYSVPIN